MRTGSRRMKKRKTQKRLDNMTDFQAKPWGKSAALTDKSSTVGLGWLWACSCTQRAATSGESRAGWWWTTWGSFKFYINTRPKRDNTAAATTARTLCTVVHICTLLSCRIHEIGFRSSGVFLSCNIFEFDKLFIKLALNFAKVFR